MKGAAAGTGVQRGPGEPRTVTFPTAHDVFNSAIAMLSFGFDGVGFGPVEAKDAVGLMLTWPRSFPAAQTQELRSLPRKCH